MLNTLILCSFSLILMGLSVLLLFHGFSAAGMLFVPALFLLGPLFFKEF